MARKSIEITLEDNDQTLRFRITQFPASKAERWLTRAAFALISSGLEVPKGAGLQASATHLAQIGVQALSGLEYEKVAPLWNELLTCCERITETGLQQVTPETLDGYIKDVKTLFALKFEALKLNFGFFVDASRLSFPAAGGSAA